MPQLAQLPDVFWSQLFWLALVFGIIFFGIGLGMLPKVEGTIDARNKQVADDLTLAEKARNEADETEAAWRAELEAGRAEAMKLTAASKQQSAREAEVRVKAADAELAERLGVAEEQIAAASAAAMADVERVAAEAAREIVAKLAAVQVSEKRAADVVRAVING
jgi:F-type H+-transporting ATPase subunit b